jgi:hypothetical protein
MSTRYTPRTWELKPYERKAIVPFLGAGILNNVLKTLKTMTDKNTYKKLGGKTQGRKKVTKKK